MINYPLRLRTPAQIHKDNLASQIMKDTNCDWDKAVTFAESAIEMRNTAAQLTFPFMGEQKQKAS